MTGGCSNMFLFIGFLEALLRSTIDRHIMLKVISKFFLRRRDAGAVIEEFRWGKMATIYYLHSQCVAGEDEKMQAQFKAIKAQEMALE